MTKILLKYELLALLRDTRTIFLSVLLPVILLPVLLFTLNRFGHRASGSLDTTYHYGRSFPSPGLEVVTDAALSSKKYRELLVDDGMSMLADGHLDILVRLKEVEKAEPELAEDIVSMFPPLEPLINKAVPARPVVEILYRSDRERSVRAYLGVSEKLQDFRDGIMSAYLKKQDADVGVDIVSQDVSSAQERAARRYGPAISSFMILMLLGGGSVAALDSLAGERERGTLSTLFVSSMERHSIARAKFCAVALISVVVAVVQILNLACYAFLGFIDWPLSVDMPSGVLAFATLLVIFGVEAIFTASLLLYISARSSSFKEAQLFFFPTFLVCFALSLAGLLPALVSRSAVSLLPLTGPAVFIPEILAGRTDLAVLLLQSGVHLLASYLLWKSTLDRMEREDFLGGQPPLHGEELKFEQFSQRALPFYALLGACLFVIPSNFEVLTTLTGQGLFNQLVLFVLGPILLLKFFGQSVKEAVPVRWVSPQILLASLLLIPLGQLAATGLSHLLGPLLPAPVKALEMMMEMLAIESTAPWLLFLLIGILPGLCEEFAFRGVLLHALHKRFSPWMLAAVVAIVFGFFHVNFFRIMPTAYLGFIMALLTLSTGSVLPAIIVHIGNNSLAVWAMLNGWDFEGMSNLVYLAGFLGQIVFVALIMKWGRGYPGTRWEKSS